MASAPLFVRTGVALLAAATPLLGGSCEPSVPFPTGWYTRTFEVLDTDCGPLLEVEERVLDVTVSSDADGVWTGPVTRPPFESDGPGNLSIAGLRFEGDSAEEADIGGVTCDGVRLPVAVTARVATASADAFSLDVEHTFPSGDGCIPPDGCFVQTQESFALVRACEAGELPGGDPTECFPE